MKEEVKKPKPEPLIFFIIDLFNSIPEQTDLKGNKIFTSDSYVILCSGVLCDALYNLYLKLIQSDVTPIELLSPVEKNRYWEIAKRYYTDKDKAIVASKSAYIISLLTNQ